MASRLLGLLLVSLCAPWNAVLAAAPVSGVGHYALDLRLDPSAGRFTGSVSIAFTRAAGDTAPLAVDMAAALKAETVVLDDQPASFTHEGDVLSVRWPAGAAAGASHVLSIRYSGLPDRQGLRFTSDPGGRYIVNFGMPYTAKHWWPDFDDPALKARSADIRISLPKDLTAVSNGSLAGVQDLPDGQHQYHWVESYPIYPDVVSIAAGAYQELDSSYTDAAGQAVPIRYYVLKQDAALAQKEFAIVPDVLKVYERFFGPYPFAKEKYGIAEVPFPSFREHQTIPSLGRGLMTGASPVWDLGTVENVIAHYMAHQWFGNSLTPTSWSDVWLNEGFATYAVALWHEQSGGAAAYRDFMRFLDSRDFSGSLYIKDEHDMDSQFTSTTFNK
ncbi:MAG TPA: M1 family aminopeptidase, partial [Gammaproteobacteria bacterium]|nr:M1 family aminopeptidase [Gammaproteobacteria bacterium]